MTEIETWLNSLTDMQAIGILAVLCFALLMCVAALTR